MKLDSFVAILHHRLCDTINLSNLPEIRGNVFVAILHHGSFLENRAGPSGGNDILKAPCLKQVMKPQSLELL